MRLCCSATSARKVSSRLESFCPACARSSSSVPSAIRRPPAMMPTRSAMRSATSRMCVVMITVPPAATRSRSTRLTCRAEPASRPVSGSSRMITRGPCTSAPASATFWRMPLEKPSQRSCACGREPEPVHQFARPRLGEFRIEAPQAGDEFEIFVGRELVVDHRLVRDPRDDALGLDRIAQRIDAADADRAGIGRQEARHHAQRRGLAGAVRAEQRVELALPHTKIETGDRRPVERFAKAANVERECHGESSVKRSGSVAPQRFQGRESGCRFR